MNGTVSLVSVHGKYLSAQPDGRAEWNRNVASTWEYFHVEQRHYGKIALKGAHGMYMSAQPDGSVEINRREAPPCGWEEFTVEERGNNVVCLKSSHGKYLSAQQDGRAQWNRDHAPRGGWEDIQIVQQNTGQRESIEIFEDVPSKPAEMIEDSNKKAAKIAFGFGIFLMMPGLPLLIIGSTSTSEDRLAILVPGAAMFGIGAFLGVIASFALISSRAKSYVETGKRPSGRKYPKPPAIEVLEKVEGKPVRFRINDPPSSSSAWVGIYPSSTPDNEHGEEGVRWNWLKKIDLSNATFPEKPEGRWSIRVFSDSGLDMYGRLDFDILPKKERWWEE